MGQNSKIALVTGASSGIGAAYADRLAKRGHDLVLVARREDRLREVAARAKEMHGAESEIITADLATPAGMDKVAARLEQGVTGMVNNAGFGLMAPFAEQDWARLNDMIQLNVTALTRLSHAAVGPMLAAGRGTIVNIASIVAFGGGAGSAVYAATKAYVLALSNALADEVGGKGIRVQCVLPGLTETEFAETAGFSWDRFPADMRMSVDALVDAAFKGLGRGERVTIPSLGDAADYDALEDARMKLFRQGSKSAPAGRYLD